MTSKVVYKGSLRTECEHLQSGTRINTDAPTDNHGLGQAFSPTDTVATAVASCMLTIMGIRAADLGADLEGAVAEVTKHMSSSPRRISKVSVEVHLPSAVDAAHRATLERAGRNCPVILSLHEGIEKDLNFYWDQD